MNIQLLLDGKDTGPFSWIEVFVLLQKGTVNFSTQGRLEGELEWKSLDDLGLWTEGNDVGPFSLEEMSYLLQEGCLDGEVQARFEDQTELNPLAEVIGGIHFTPSSSSECNSSPINWSQRIKTKLHTLFQQGFASVSKFRWQTKHFAFAALFIPVFMAGWLLRGLSQGNDSHHVQSMGSGEVSGQRSLLFIDHNSFTTPSWMHSVAPQGKAWIETSKALVQNNDQSQQTDAIQAATVVSEPENAQTAEQPAPKKEAALSNTVAESPEATSGTDKGTAEEQKADTLTVPPAPASTPFQNSDVHNVTSARTVPMAQKPKSEAVEKLRPFETPQLKENDLDELLKERFSSTQIKLLDSYDSRPAAGLKVFEGSFVLDTKLVNNPKVEIIYRVPQFSKSRTGPDADNIIMIGIYHGAIQPRTKKIVDGIEVLEKSRLNGPLTPFCDQLGYTAFTMHIATTPEMAADKKEYYAYGGPDWVDLVFRAKAEIEQRHKLKDKKLLLYGVSEGGQFVQNIAAACPDKIGAVATQSGPDITPPEKASDTAWFLAITRGDSMQASYEAVYNRLLEQKGNVAFNIFPPNYKGRGVGGNFYHSQSQYASLASRSFIRGVVEHYDSTGKIDRARWPYVRDRTKPLRIYPSGSAQKILPQNREYLPSRSFAQCLQNVPAPMHSVTLTTDTVKTIKAFVGLPPLGKPKGVMIYTQAFNILDFSQMFDNIYYLAGMGYVVIAPQLKKNDAADISAAMRYASRSESLKKFPMLVVGYGDKAKSAWDVIARSRDISPKAVAMLEFKPQDAFDESKLPPGCRMDVPVVFVYDEAPLVGVATSKEAKDSLEIVTSVKEFVTKCKERSQLAKVVIIPKPASKKDEVASDDVKKLQRVRATQQSLEAAESFLTNVAEKKISAIKP